MASTLPFLLPFTAFIAGCAFAYETLSKTLTHHLLGLSLPPSWTDDPCQFSYLRFHLYFTIPPTILLYLINRPFLTRLDRGKLIFLPAIAFVWTTPWDNELVRQRAWRYPKSCVIGTVGYVPYEEYFFFLIQSVMTTLLTSFLSRWILPTSYLFASTTEQSRKVLRPSLISLACCLTAIVGGTFMTRPGQHTYYMGMILWWCAIPLGLLGWGTSNFLSRMPWKGGKGVFVLSVLLPSIYLWGTDIFALRRGTWHINEATSLEVFPLPDLPIEEMVFFVVTNLLLVIASFTFDRCIALARVGLGLSAGVSASQPPYSPSYLPLDLHTIKALWGTFIAADPLQDRQHSYEGHQAEQRDLDVSLRVLSRASKSFSMAALLLPWDLRTDLSVLYAFCRAADDCVDDEEVVGEGNGKQQRIELLHQLVDAIYLEGSTTAEAKATIRRRLGEPDQQEGRKTRASSAVSPRYSHLSEASREELRASASAVVSLRHLVPKSLWEELLRGYERDLRLDLEGVEGRFEDMDELIEYAQCVAGCVGEMCVRVVLGRCGTSVPSLEELGVERTIALDPDHGFQPLEDKNAQRPREGDEASTSRYLIHHARRMGVALQLVNIARDIVDDSVQLKRCYLPASLLKGDEKDARTMLTSLFKGDLDLRQDPQSTRNGNGSVKAKSKSISPTTLRPYSLQLLSIATTLYNTSLPAISALQSTPTRSGLRAACYVYFAISESILQQDEGQIQRGERAGMSSWKRAGKAWRAVYLSG